MPSRWLCVSIVLFWLTMTGWLFWRDLWPNWRPGEPPPYQIDPVEEVQKNNPIKTFWSVRRRSSKDADGVPVFRATTWIEYHEEDDTYSMHARLDAAKDPKFQPVYGAKVFKVESLASVYRVTRAGRLVAVEATMETTPHFDGFAPGLSALVRPLFRTSPREKPAGESGHVANPSRRGAWIESVHMRIWGEVRDEQFFAHCSASSDALEKPMQFDLPPTEVSYTGSVLLPLHPVQRIRGLRAGQSWRQPLVDPLRDAFASLPGVSGGVRSLHARVLPSFETLSVEKVPSECLVIEYTDDENELVGRTLIERGSERVLRQEVYFEGTQWVMSRERSLESLRSVMKR